MALLSKILRGLTAVFAVLVAISVTMGVVMEQYPSSLDTYFGTLSSEVVTEVSDEADWVFQSDFKTAQETVEGMRDFAISAADETMTLLKNENNALPLSSDETKVTLLGLRSYAAIYGNNGGSTPDTKAVEDNTIYDSFEDEGLEVNETVQAIYKDYVKDMTWAPSSYGNSTPSYSELNLMDSVPEVDLSSLGTQYDTSNKEYNVAILVFGRPGGETYEYRPGDAGWDTGSANDKSASGNILGLSQKEMSVVNYAKAQKEAGNFSKIIVLINNTQQMEIDDLKTDSAIDSILWIGYPGAYGFHSVARVLTGQVNPSGHLGDTYAVNTAINPAMMNFGDDTEWTNTDGLDDINSYLIQAEGIYTGYRYYETRYYDSIVNSDSNAKNADAGQWVDSDGKAGTSSTSNWNYEDEVSYTFGYGLSYTTFTQEFDSTPVIPGNLKTDATFKVKVTNTGDVAGKAVVQLYAQAPYTSYDKTNKVEKAAIQLIDYEKTDVIEPGESQVVTLYVDMANIASYDYTNAKTFIMDYGDYYFALGTDAHDALNNVLAAQGKTTTDGMTAAGDADLAYNWEYKSQGGDSDEIDALTFSVSDNGTEITNQLTEGQYATDFNAFSAGTVTYLSRSDWKGTYPKTYSDLSAKASTLLQTQLSDDFYTISTTDDTSDFVWGVDNGDENITLSQMKLAEWDDNRWDTIVDQVTIAEYLDFAANAFHNIQGIDSVGYAGNNADDGPNGSDSHYINEGKYQGEEFADADTVNPDSRNGYTYGDYGTRMPPSSTNLAYSFNKELCYQDGSVILGESTLVLELPIMIGPGANLHRTAYNGRGAEYYSEDPILSGFTGSAMVQGAQSKGCLVNIKHLGFNDQEINRSGIAVFLNEQKAREMELRNFEQIFEAKGKPSSYTDAEGDEAITYTQGALGLMTSYNRIGATASSANYNVMVNIVREEWGFKGYNVTDFTGVSLRAAPKESIIAGTTAFCGFGTSVGYWDTDSLKNDKTICSAIKTDIKYILYSLANSAAINGTNDTTHRVQLWSKWRILYTTLEAVTGTLLGLCAVAYVVTEVVPAVKKKKEG